MNRLTATVSIAALLSLASHAAIAGTLSGVVKDNSGQALEGAMIRLTDPASGMSESVFSNARGEFVVTTALQGKLTVRLRKPYHRDHIASIELSDEATVNTDFTMEVMTDPREISDS
ncbi:MAG: carboxypeptidase-like regulatory domain-containing protein, partial [Gammaproteobacteria bacterium]